MALSTGVLPELSFVGQGTHFLFLLSWFLSILFCRFRYIQQQIKSGFLLGVNSQRVQFLCSQGLMGWKLIFSPREDILKVQVAHAEKGGLPACVSQVYIRRNLCEQGWGRTG